MHLPSPALHKSVNPAKLAIVAISLGCVGFLVYIVFQSLEKINNYNSDLETRVGTLTAEVNDVKSQYQNFNDNLEESLFEDHLKLTENIRLRGELAELQTELETLKSTEKGSDLVRVSTIYKNYLAFQNDIKRNIDVKLDTKSAQDAALTWGQLLLDKKYDELDKALADEGKKLDDAYKKYLATLPKPAAVTGGGYSTTTVDTEIGKFTAYVIKVAKGSVKVKTLAAIEDDCEDNCATKSLQEYVNENNGFAGMAGSYSCPKDYAQCAGKIWTFDFALYDSNDGKWFNKKALGWSDTGLMTFNGSSSKMYEKSTDYGGSGVSAAISNFPSLVVGGNVVVDSGDIDSFQASKTTRGAIGTDDNNIYLAYITKASVIDAAYAMKALGAKSALNLDGGGSAAMYINGKYIIGPGRPLPNAVVLIK